MNNSDMAAAILRHTRGGDTLSAAELALLQVAVNIGLSDFGRARLQQLHRDVTAGAHPGQGRWFRGVEHVTRDDDGNLCWRGISVDGGYFFPLEPAAEATVAEGLALRCRALESAGFPVNARSTSSRDCYEAPVGTPWTAALLRYYAFFRKGRQVMVTAYRPDPKPSEPTLIGAYRDERGVHIQQYRHPRHAMAEATANGWACTTGDGSYADTESLLIATGLNGAELAQIIETGCHGLAAQNPALPPALLQHALQPRYGGLVPAHLR